MPYIGKEPVAGNFVLLDSITTSATATYALTKDSVAYSPESARNMIVSLNGVTQAPEAAFTVSGSNITFSSALTSSDVIDYILVLGDVLSVGTPSDGTVGTSQMSYPLDNFSSTGIDDNATSTTITIDSSENVGIGTSSIAAEARLAVDGGRVYIDADDAFGLRFLNSGTSGAFIGTSAADTLNFYNGTGTERMRIDSSGNVGIGTTSPAAKAEIYGAAASSNIALRVTNTATNGYSTVQLGDANAGIYRNGSAQSAYAGANSLNLITVGSHDIGFSTANTLRMRIDSSGNAYFYANGGELRFTGHSFYRPGASGSGIHLSTNRVLPANENGSVSDNTEDLGSGTHRFKDLYLSGGAYLGGTGSANYLDDYEEGTWTPAVTQGSATFLDFKYVKIGNLVYVTGFVYNLTDRSTAGNFNITGLPFTSSSTHRGGQMSLYRFINRGDAGIVQYISANTSTIGFYGNNLNGDYSPVYHSHMSSSASNYYVSITYRVD